MITVIEVLSQVCKIRILIHGYGVSCAALSVNEMQTPLYRFGKSPKPVRIEDIFEVCEEIPQVLMTPVDGNPEFIHVSISQITIVHICN